MSQTVRGILFELKQEGKIFVVYANNDILFSTTDEKEAVRYFTLTVQDFQ